LKLKPSTSTPDRSCVRSTSSSKSRPPGPTEPPTSIRPTGSNLNPLAHVRARGFGWSRQGRGGPRLPRAVRKREQSCARAVFAERALPRRALWPWDFRHNLESIGREVSEPGECHMYWRKLELPQLR